MEPTRKIYGLDVILSHAAKPDTLHAISPPPRREEFASDEEYRGACWRSFCWAASVLTADEINDPNFGEPT